MFIVRRFRNNQASYLTNAELWTVNSDLAVRLSKSDAESLVKDLKDSESDRHESFRHKFSIKEVR